MVSIRRKGMLVDVCLDDEEVKFINIYSFIPCGICLGDEKY
jgi:hypothetical protein